MKLALQPRPPQTLADQLFQSGVEFPCGGESSCGGCRVRIVEGDVPVTAAMREALTEAEIRDGWRLACCATATAEWLSKSSNGRCVCWPTTPTSRSRPRAGLGAAIDLGTTTLVVQVVDLSTGEVLRVETALNPQARHGADVMSRLAFELQHPGPLGHLVRQTLGGMLGQQPLSEVLICGNTAMHHLFCGLDVEPLTRAPFLSHHLRARRFEAVELGWPGPAEFLPCLGGS